MKRSVICCLSVLMTNTAWAVCDLTTDTLRLGGDAIYDDYLYQDSKQYELRHEGKKAYSYLCGSGYCSVGTKIRLKNAMVGGTSVADAVYECQNSSATGRTSYKWVKHEVNATCTVTPPQDAKTVTNVANAGTLYELNGKYCAQISQQPTNNSTNFWGFAQTTVQEKAETFRTILSSATQVTVAGINGGVELIISHAKENTQRIKIFTNGAVSMLDSTGKTINGLWKTTADGVVRIYDSTGKTLVGGLKIAKDGAVQIFDSANRTVQTITKEASASYRASLQFFSNIITNFSQTVQETIKGAANVAGIAIQEAGATVRNVLDNAKDVTVSAMGNGVELVTSYAKENTKRIKIFADGTVSIVDSAGNTISSVWKSTTDGVVRIYDSTGKTVIGGLKIAKDGAVQIFDSANKTIRTIAKDAGASYRASIQFFSNIITNFSKTVQETIKGAASVAGIAIQEAGATVRNAFDNATKFTISGMDNGVELVTSYATENTKRIKIFADGTVSIIDTAGNTMGTMWKSTTDGVVSIYDTTGKTVIGGLKIAKDGTVQIFNSANKTIRTIAQDTGASYRAMLQFFGNIMNNFNSTVQETIKGAANIAGITIKEAGATVRTAMNNATDFAKHLTSEILGGVKSFQINKYRLKSLEEQIAKCQTQEQVSQLIAVALREAELSEKQCAQVRQMINAYAKKQNVRFNVIENKIMNLEQELNQVQQQNIEMSNEIANLGSQYNSLAAQVRSKVNAKQVIQLINEHTQKFSDGQTQELYKILAEYTKKLSDGQRAEVQEMIALYVDPKIAQLDTKVNLEADRRAAEGKVLSAMSVLNSFAASADVSVWKTAEGKFNTARLASDSIAGVVLGTAGGLISNSLIKKSQTKKGFENIRCSVGGQFVAEYNDEFVVGMQ